MPTGLALIVLAAFVARPATTDPIVDVSGEAVADTIAVTDYLRDRVVGIIECCPAFSVAEMLTRVATREDAVRHREPTDVGP